MKVLVVIDQMHFWKQIIGSMCSLLRETTDSQTLVAQGDKT